MRILTKRTLRAFWEHPANRNSERALRHWYEIAECADWSGPHDVKAQFGNASVVGGNRVVFNIAGNRYRMVVKFNYTKRLGFVRFIGTHEEYDRIDAEQI